MYKFLPIGLSLIILVAMVGIRINDPSIVVGLRYETFDAYQKWLPRQYQDVPVKILDIDDESLERLGQWPWSRDIMADIVTRLNNRGAVVVFDMFFSEPDRTSPSRMLSKVNDPAASKLLLNLPDHDSLFAESISNGTVVLGFASKKNESDKLKAPPIKFGIATAGPDPKSYLPRISSRVGSLPTLEAAARGVGSLNFTVDRDGVVRRIPLFLEMNDDIFPSLSLEALRVAQGASTYIIKSVGAHNEQGLGTQTGITEIKVGALSVPTDANGHLWLYYTPSRPDRYLPAWKLLEDKINPAQIEGAIVIIGPSAVGLNDIRHTPFGVPIPGVEIQAQVIEQILSQDFLNRPDWADGAEILFIILIGFSIPILAYRLPPLTTALALGLILLATFGQSLYLYKEMGLLLDPIYPSLTTLAVYLIVSLLHHMQTEGERKWIRNAFGSYVSPNLVEDIINSRNQLELGGERRELSFIFTDLADFTPLVEKTNPEELIPILNDYLNNMIKIGFRHGGTLDMINGDATTFFFNAPVEQKNHAERALACALEMDGFALSFMKKMNEEGYPIGITRIGIHTGNVIVGNMGGDVLFNYCAHGDAINTAARLESLNKHLGTRICLSIETAQKCPAFIGRPVGSIVLKGKSGGIEVFEPLTIEELESDNIQDYLKAFDLLTSSVGLAKPAFAKLTENYPKDPLARFHYQRLNAGKVGRTIFMQDK